MQNATDRLMQFAKWSLIASLLFTALTLGSIFAAVTGWRELSTIGYAGIAISFAIAAQLARLTHDGLVALEEKLAKSDA